MEFKKALSRLNLLRGHVNPSKDAQREMATATFDLEYAQEKVWSTLHDNFFETYEWVSEIKEIEDPSTYVKSVEEMREDTNVVMIKLINKMFEKGFTTPEKIADNIEYFLDGILSFGVFDLAATTKIAAQYGLYAKTIKNLGTERHKQLLLDACSLKTIGCYCLTELGHGSNVNGLETIAEYNKSSKEFILNSPTDTSMKFWIGGLGKTATNAWVFAQLLIEENGKVVNKGVHAFIIQIRDRKTHFPLPGIEVGDSGHKKGMNGMDNGFIKFKDYRVSRESLLNKFGDVTEDGSYSTSIESNGKRFANSLASLSSGRVIICRSSSVMSLVAWIIAIRYAGVRRQFGPKSQETLLLDYPLHQYRLISRFAEHLINLVGANRIMKMWWDNLPTLLEPGNKITDLCHALSSNEKAFIAWRGQETITDWRRACGGNGFSYYAMFGIILNYNDLHSTWEGDSHVLMMQTQSYLLKSLTKAMNGEELPATLEFLTLNQHDKPKFTGSIENIEELHNLFAQKACYLAIKAGMRMQKGGDLQTSFLDKQAFELKSMCEAYHEIFGIDTFKKLVDGFKEGATKKVFEQLLLLYMHNRIIENSRFFSSIFDDEAMENIEDLINSELKSLRGEIVKLTLLLPMPNRIYGALGNEDMQVYERFVQHVRSAPKVTERPSWWKLVCSDSSSSE
jgi:acyl-CoA oxidase